ncbi:glycoside hydrolase domain-containing protein [Streptomyces luteireticuli]|uniref:Rv2525c-like glycoside hydrolase-like domain-containing protein n=1 Tax=Streptomyces luteireticuli TaxID=173858 RepID=A0ABP3I2J1_9ACTN
MRTVRMRRTNGTAFSAAAAAALMVLAASGTAMARAVPSDAGRPGTTPVTYRGLTLDVPSGWPVVDLEKSPDTCVRLDRHTVYLGHPGPEQSCPSHLVADKTDALILEPITGAGGQDVSHALRVPTGAPVPHELPVTYDHETKVAVEGAGVMVTASYGTSSTKVAAVLGSARPDATAKPTPLPGKAGSGLVAPPVAAVTADKGYTGPGFESCTAPSSAAMKAWKASSPYGAVGIYIGGRKRGCQQPQLTADWVRQQTADGWHLLPLFVDLQAGDLSPATADAQGRESADAAVAKAADLGLGPGTVIYSDMENYDNRSYRARVIDYVSGWTSRLHERGYRSGVYAGKESGVPDLASAANDADHASPDVLWSANWNLKADVSDASMGLPGPGYWTDGRRIHQYRGEVNDTYGGVTLAIDRDYVDVAPASALPALGGEDGSSRIKGDFDGDGRDDVAVLYDYGKEGGVSRSGLWTLTGSGGGFGSPKKVWDSGAVSWSWSAAKLTVGDFNGDGKADVGVLYDMGRTEDGRNRTKLFVFTSTGSGFAAPVKVWDSNDDPVKSWNWNASKLTVGDFNGDGKTDIGVLYDSGKTDSGNRAALWTFTSNGSGFNSPKQVWDSSTDPVKSWNWAASKPVAGDFNGDGRADVGVLYDYGRAGSGNRTGLWTFTSTGGGFASPKQAWDSGSESWRWSAAKVVGGDFNGDGKADIGVLYDLGRNGDRNRTELFTFAGNAAGLNAPTKVWDSQDDSAVKSWNWAASKPVAGDFNGDGRTDVGVLYDYGRTDSGNRTGLWTFTSTGNGFSGPGLAWDSRTDSVKSWNWNMSKVG